MSVKEVDLQLEENYFSMDQMTKPNELAYKYVIRKQEGQMVVHMSSDSEKKL